MLDPVKDFEVLLHNKPSDARPLPHLGVALGEETEAFARLNDKFAKVTCCGWIASRDQVNDSLKVLEECVLEDYFEVH